MYDVEIIPDLTELKVSLFADPPPPAPKYDKTLAEKRLQCRVKVASVLKELQGKTLKGNKRRIGYLYRRLKKLQNFLTKEHQNATS